MSDGAKLSEMAYLRKRISELELKNRQIPASKEQEQEAREQAQANEIQEREAKEQTPANEIPEREAKQQAQTKKLIQEREEKEPAQVSTKKALGEYCIMLSDLEYELKDLPGIETLKALQGTVKHDWFCAYVPPHDTDPVDNKNRGNDGLNIGFTLFHSKRSKVVNGVTVSTKRTSQAAHAMPYGSCSINWGTIPHYFLKFPLTDFEANKKILNSVMHGWQDEKGCRVVHSGFIPSFSNFFAMQAQGQVVDSYPQMLGLPAVSFRQLLDSKVTDEITWVIIFADAHSARLAGACEHGPKYLKISDPIVQLAFDTYKVLLPFLAQLAVLDSSAVCSNQRLAAELRQHLREEKKIPVPTLPADPAFQERYVYSTTLRKGMVVQPTKELSLDQMEELQEGHHGLEPFIASAKFSQSWTTYLHSMGILKLPTTEKAQPCSLFPGCEGVDEYGLPEYDRELVIMLLNGDFEVGFSDEEIILAQDSFAGDCDCLELRNKIYKFSRTVSRCIRYLRPYFF